jgi:hypothetical protein
MIQSPALCVTDRIPVQSAPGGSRSHDPALKRRLLYQLSYRGLFGLKRTSTA